MLSSETYDVAIIGGGINGTGIARDAAGRGLKVFLCEKNDLASATSSASTKLIHGGLRYLEHYEFRLVREALIEREVLLRAAPHIIWPLRFVLPHVKGLRPAWMIRLGLFLYDHLGGREKLPGSEGIKLKNHPAGKPLVEGMNKAFVYSDCWVQDARLVVLNAMSARDLGAEIETRTECVSAKRDGDLWKVVIRNEDGERTIRARSVVNAAGPWCAELLENRVEAKKKQGIRMVQGSHIVVPKLFDHDYCYIFQNPDGRIVFAIPYEQDFTLIGTTDRDYKGDPAKVAISADETDYLCQLTNTYFEKKITPDDVVWAYSGVRPLYGDGSEDASQVTRDYVLEIDKGDRDDNAAPLLNIYGGKITTYRRLAESAMSKICPLLGHDDIRWTADKPLPGGDMPNADFDDYFAAMHKKFSWIPKPHIYRYVQNYGTLTKLIIDGASDLEGLGKHFGDDVYECELRYLVDREWARTVEDVLWRRSKLGLHLSDQTRDAITQWFDTELKSKNTVKAGEGNSGI
ncbi:glycerol-3-phosphate dehydrogenase [Thalassospira lucentensis]|uniref:glycerol-3-phosphate dehydrogenase n=1 Tax=Thalassospira lucentensis TaxID=168935 RepID=UPI0003B4E69F|nr:glycerol-3-phosphate dehydrogenase [Thalassospira lucentensis]RCK29581.1 glycerol-3-phosphate dehydrogenase [Thalassospira lucentensis MCCC 1A00383 = DSM 14000]